MQDQIDLAIGVKIRRTKRNPVFLRGSGQKILGQIGAIVGSRGVGADDRDGAGIAFAAQHLGCGKTSGPASDNDDRIGRLTHGRGAVVRWREFFSNEDGVIAALDAPAWDRIEGRRP